MKIAIVDITGRNASQYNPSLCHSISKQANRAKVTLCSPTLAVAPDGYGWLKLLSLLPKKMAYSSGTGPLKKILRGIEASINYLFLGVWCFIRKPDIIHFQWLPFVEYSGIEPIFLRILRVATPKSKMYLTVHNVYPHLLNENQRANYRKRFDALKKYLSGYLVHLESSKRELAKELGIDERIITVAYHGIYVPTENQKNLKKAEDGVVRLIMYGYQTPYKGADILVEALDMLPTDYKEKIRCTIMGKTDPQILEKSQKKAEKNHVEWIDRFVSDEELYNAIGLSDLILLPYRSISQSGVLLLALSFKKPILTSDLQSFKETLEGYPEDYFFKSDDPQSLSKMLERFVDGKIDVELQMEVIEKLNDKYSWKNTALSTINAYQTVLGNNKN